MKAVTIAVLALMTTTIAHADERITDDTAYVLPEGKTRVGLWKLQYGIPKVSGLEVGTYMLPYLTWAFDLRSVNAHAKYQLLDRGRWAVAGNIGVTYVDFANLDVPADVTIVPAQMLTSFRAHDRFTFGLGAMYTEMFGEGSYNEDDDKTLQGAVAVSNAQAWLSLTTRISRGWSLYIEARGITSARAHAAGDAMVVVDDRTHIDVAATGRASVEELRGASSLAAFQYSGRRVRARFGLGYGNFNVPMLNFIVPVATPFPDFDLYWVF
jgi:hypothetical protein